MEIETVFKGEEHGSDGKRIEFPGDPGVSHRPNNYFTQDDAKSLEVTRNC